MKSAGFDGVVIDLLPVAGSEILPTLTRRKNESLRASAESIGKNGLRSGVIVRYDTRLYVVKSIDPEGMDLLILNGPLRLTRKLPVVAAKGRGRHLPLVAVEYLPRSGFVHIAQRDLCQQEHPGRSQCRRAARSAKEFGRGRHL